jgi:hypothetical protein
MKVMRSLGILVASAAFATILASTGWSQTTGTGTGTGPGTGSGRNGGLQTTPPSGITMPSGQVGPDANPSPQMEEEQAKMRAVDRQKQLVNDTQKLLALANELKVQVDKSNKDTLSLDVIRKADEIEKLAHNVKEKMKGN